MNPDGSATWTGTLWIPNIFDLANTGVGTITLTPAGGWANLPVLAQGAPGLPAVIDSVSVTTLDPAATPPPTQSAQLTLVDPGGPGQAAHYTLTLNLLKGAAGATGAAGHILGSADFANTPADGQVPVYAAAGKQVVWATIHPVTPSYVLPGTAFTALSESASGARDIVAALTIPAQSYRYRPRVSGDLEVTGAAGMRIDAEVRMGPQATPDATISTTGTLIGYGRGQDSASPVHLGISPFFGAAMSPTDTNPAAAIPPGTAARIVLTAVRQYGSAAWTTSQALGELRITLDPV
ncbi:hypothetical protein AWN90_40030 [Nocardia terpenica]|uniref:Minor tail protein n=1 Tax=Nocardia terpenica TaxID=455432 RepID=A0A164JV51_9NOCA|nr:hypothetical protein AWN90_40030 [Nocardia terpenica]